MLHRNLLPACLVGAAVVVMASPARAADALLPTEVAKIAKHTVVRIEPRIAGSGSGVVIGRYRKDGENAYVVLTAAHVVKASDDEYTIISPWPIKGNEREKIKIDNRDIKKLPGLDLALVTFCSDRDYQVATLGNSDFASEGAGVYIAGFPSPGAAIQRRIFQFTGALVSSRLDGEAVQSDSDTGPIAGGYAVVYTNVTRAGMSGGPVFDVAGRVVAIHGLGDRELTEMARGQQSGTETGAGSVGDKTGFNLGIPISTFLKAMPKAPQLIGARYDSSQPNGFIGTRTATNSGLNPVMAEQVRSMNMNEEEDSDSDMVSEPVNQRSNPSRPSGRRAF
jgi:hypothetical protein